MKDLDRRDFVVVSAGAVAGGVLGCRRSEPTGEPAAKPAVRGSMNPAVIRVASVPTAVEGNVLPVLIRGFEERSSYRVEPLIDGINVEGSRAFQQFLLEPATQARMRTIEYSDDEKIAVWVPAGRHNRNAVLPGTGG